MQITIVYTEQCRGGLFGHEGHHMYLRLMAVIELLLNQTTYDENSWDYHDFIQDQRVVTRSYKELVMSTYTIGDYAELAHMYLLSAVVKQPLRSYYPPTMKNRLLSEPFSRTVVGRNARYSQDPALIIMWTSVIEQELSVIPHPFRALEEIHKTTNGNRRISRSVTIADDDQEDNLSQDWPSQSEWSSTETIDEINDLPFDIKTSSAVDNIHAGSVSGLFDDGNEQQSIGIGDIASFSRGETSAPNTTSNGKKNAPNIQNDSVNENIVKGRVPYDGLHRGKLLHGRFHETDDVLQLLTNSDGSLSQVPLGVKEDIFFIVDQTNDEERKQQGRKRDFWDDCGTWTKGSSPNAYFLPHGGRLISLIKRQGMFSTSNQVNKSRVYRPLDPQPNECDLLIINRVYSEQKLSSDYKRRIHWISNVPESLSIVKRPVALIEYKGTFPGRVPHGNVKTKDGHSAYIRVTDNAKEAIRQRVTTQNQKQKTPMMN